MDQEHNQNDDTLGLYEDVETLDDIEHALERSLESTESDDARYQIRRALQKLEVIREGQRRDESEFG